MTPSVWEITKLISVLLVLVLVVLSVEYLVFVGLIKLLNLVFSSQVIQQLASLPLLSQEYFKLFGIHIIVQAIFGRVWFRSGNVRCY